MKRLLVIACIAICFGFIINTSAQKVKPTPTPTPSSNIPVTVKYEQYGANGTLNRVTMDGVKMPDNITDKPYSHNEDNVSALFQIDNGSRDLTINFRNSATRSVGYDFRQVTNETASNVPGWRTTDPSDLTVPYTPQLFKTGMNVIGAYRAKDICNPVPVDGCNYPARITTVGISVSGYSYNYRLLWNPTPENPTPANEPEDTSYVNVHYKVDENDKDVFTITPLPNCATPSNDFICPAGTIDVRPIAGLEATYTGKGKATVSSAGQYIMPFTLVVRPK